MQENTGYTPRQRKVVLDERSKLQEGRAKKAGNAQSKHKQTVTV